MAKRRLRMEQEELRAARAIMTFDHHDNATEYDAHSLVQFPSTSATSRSSPTENDIATSAVTPTYPVGDNTEMPRPAFRFATATGGIMADENENPPLSAVGGGGGRTHRRTANRTAITERVGAWGLAQPSSDGASSVSGSAYRVPSTVPRSEYEPPSHQESVQHDLEGIISTLAVSRGVCYSIANFHETLPLSLCSRYMLYN